MLHAGLATADAAYGAAFRALLAEAGSELADRFVLCLVLLVERLKGDASAWAPYINMLPKTYGEHLSICRTLCLKHLVDSEHRSRNAFLVKGLGFNLNPER